MSARNAEFVSENIRYTRPPPERDLPETAKAELREFFSAFGSIRSVYLAWTPGAGEEQEGFLLGIELAQGCQTRGPLVVDLIHQVVDGTQECVGEHPHRGAVVVNNLDRLFPPDGRSRFVAASERLYERGLDAQ